MKDEEILDLYFARNEQAIIETDKSHGAVCMQVSMNILHSRSDAEECLNDTYLRAWQTIPPERPTAFRTFLCKIIRNISLDRFRYLHRDKRNRSLEVLFSELEDCLPTPEVSKPQLAADLTEFLRKESEEDRLLFLGRYYHAFPVKTLARRAGLDANLVSVRLYRLREKLRLFLQEKGYDL